MKMTSTIATQDRWCQEEKEIPVKRWRRKSLGECCVTGALGRWQPQPHQKTRDVWMRWLSQAKSLPVDLSRGWLGRHPKSVCMKQMTTAIPLTWCFPESGAEWCDLSLQWFARPSFQINTCLSTWNQSLCMDSARCACKQPVRHLCKFGLAELSWICPQLYTCCIRDFC